MSNPSPNNGRIRALKELFLKIGIQLDVKKGAREKCPDCCGTGKGEMSRTIMVFADGSDEVLFYDCELCQGSGEMVLISES